MNQNTVPEGAITDDTEKEEPAPRTRFLNTNNTLHLAPAEVEKFLKSQVKRNTERAKKSHMGRRITENPNVNGSTSEDPEKTRDKTVMFMRDKNFMKEYASNLYKLKNSLKNIHRKKVYLLPVSGYGVLNCNMTVLLYDKKMIIIDAGSYTDLPDNCMLLTEEYLSKQTRKSANIKPLLELLLYHGYELEAVFLTHSHADHMGGLHELANALKKEAGINLEQVPLYIGEYVYEYGKKDILFKNIVYLENQRTLCLNEKVKVLVYYLNHSSLYSVALYFNIFNTKILFLPDHRWDHYPCEQTNKAYISHEQIQEIQKTINQDAPDCVILEGTRGFSNNVFKLNLPEESVCIALKNYLCYLSDIKQTLIVSTYATNPIRIRAVFEAAKRKKRTVAVLGGSMLNSVETMFKTNLLEPEYRPLFKKITTDLTDINKKKSNYIILCTGHMGEPGAGLKKLLKDTLHYVWSKDDAVILSSTTIPKEVCIYNRMSLNLSLKARRILVLDGDTTPELHTSGHLANQDYLCLINSFKNTKKYIVNHGDEANNESLALAFKIAEIPKTKLRIPKNFELCQL